MNPMLQRHCAKFIYIVPDGLRELMSDISREVIRTQPENVYTYIADYLDALMITRENARIAARLVDSICEIAETTVQLLLRVGLSRSEADAIVVIIQTAFREYLERKKKYPPSEFPGEMGEEEDFMKKIFNQIKVSADKVEQAVIIIQTAWRNFKERQEREKKMLFGMVDWRIAARSAIMLYRKTGVTMYEANRAATLIKAAYKGYYTRRIMKRLLHMGLEDEVTEQIESTISADYDLESETGEFTDYLSDIGSYGEDGTSHNVLTLEAGASDASHPHRERHTRPRHHTPSRRATAAAKTTTASKSKIATASETKSAKATTSQEKRPSWTAPADGPVTIEKRESLPRDADALHPEDYYPITERLSEAGEGGISPSVPDVIEDDEKMQTPPNTEQEEVSEGVEADEAPTEAEGEVVAGQDAELEAPTEAAEIPPGDDQEVAEAPEEVSNEDVAEPAAEEAVSATETQEEVAAAEPQEEVAPPGEPVEAEPAEEAANEVIPDDENEKIDGTADETNPEQ
ncbi:unconventional myosin-IXAa-like [Atheta coriaria]|uniref:unconventional myosin-IXAa-like n=1 Tax=Dalotia coriaria TaxID=877792 RepID=UPI0031F4729D